MHQVLGSIPNTAQSRHDGAHLLHACQHSEVEAGVRSSGRLGREMMPPQKKRVKVFLTLQNQTKYLRDLQKQAKKKEKQNHYANFARLIFITILLSFGHRQLRFLGHSTLPGLRILQGPLVSISPTIPAFLHYQHQCGHLPRVTVTHRPTSVL